MMQRTVLMVQPEQYNKLNDLAAKSKVSAAEINRRAIDAYNPNSDKEREDLEKLAQLVIQSNTYTLKVLYQAHREVKSTLKYFRNKKENR